MRRQNVEIENKKEKRIGKETEEIKKSNFEGTYK
jgi:hypothetical protein